MSDYRRFFVDKIDDVITIDGEEFRHAVNVLRIKEGESIILLDNSGYEYTSVVEKINKKDLTAKVVSKTLSENEPKTKVALITGYLKGDKTELVVQKAVELGISQIIVFNSKFCSAYMNDNKLARLNKVAVESAKQCKRAVVPKVDYVDNFNDALKSCESYDIF
jgi:16S rRNA (uracil1498-N3)-methyltransferase